MLTPPPQAVDPQDLPTPSTPQTPFPNPTLLPDTQMQRQSRELEQRSVSRSASALKRRGKRRKGVGLRRRRQGKNVTMRTMKICMMMTTKTMMILLWLKRCVTLFLFSFFMIAFSPCAH
jgi:hypothetical protein